MARYGIFFLKSSNRSLRHLYVGRQRVDLSLPPDEDEVHQHEIFKILIEDCYRLSELREINSILDIGANVGLFCMAARAHFPKAQIHAYEPNEELEKHLKQNCESIGIECFPEAVGNQEGMVSIVRRENTLHSTTDINKEGTIQQSRFRSAVEKMGGHVDLVKLDCEGAEWEIFEDSEPWKTVKFLTMEYHLWAKPGSTLDSLVDQIDKLGFQVNAIYPSQNANWGMLQATNRTSLS